MDGTVRPGQPEELLEITGADAGSIGPLGFKHRIIVDNRIKDANNMFSGANKNDCHFGGIDFNRDVDKWIFGLMRNASRQILIDEKRHGMSHNEETDGLLLPSKVGNPEDTRRLKEVMERINQEPEEKSYILRLSLIDQFDAAEVAQIVPENENTVRNIVYRFRKENRKEFR